VAFITLPFILSDERFEEFELNVEVNGNNEKE